MNNTHSAGGGTGGGNTGGGRKRRNHKQHQQRNNSREAASSVVLLDDPNDLNYSVHHSHSYTAVASYDMRRDPSQSRNRRGDIDNWQQRGEPSHSVHDRGYDDLPRRNGGGRNSYDRLDRDGEGWSAVVDPYGTPSRDWQPTEGYPPPPPQGYPSYGDAGYNSGRRAVGYDWVEEDRRLPPENGRRFVDDGTRGWRDGGGQPPQPPPQQPPPQQQQRFVSDSGWDSRFVENREAVPYLEEPRPDDQARNWEPAPGWKQNQHGRPNHQHRNQRNQQRQGDGNANQSGNFGNNNNHNRGNRQGKKGKKWKNKDKQRGEWKQQQQQHQQQQHQQDDQNPNNWTRRDTSQVSGVNQIPLKRRQQRSRSRSGSPTNSFYSRRSSHGGRSRSRSPSPKRLRHSVSPSRHDSSPVNKRQKWKKNRHSDNQQTRDRGRARRRSPSPVGSTSSRSVSSASSRSSGAGDRPRTLHRLPTATNVRDIDITLSMSKTTAAWDHSPKNTRRGRDQSTSPKIDRANKRPMLEPNPKLNFGADMPPPPVPRTFHQPGAEGPQQLAMPSLAKGKKAGFRPIGSASSSLRQFFPADDDEEPIPKSRDQAVTPPRSSFQEHDRERDRDREPEPVQEHRSSDRMSIEMDMSPPPPLPPREPARGTMYDPLPYDPASGPPHSPTPTWSPAYVWDEPREAFSIMTQVGEGTFGKVYKARNNTTNAFVALKRVRMEAERDGFPVTAMREIKLLQSLRHDNVVRLHEMMVSNGAVYMVFQYMDHDLTGVLSQTQFTFSDAQLKSLCQQMLAGLSYLHQKGVIHRDIKGSNILVNSRGELKLADFGLARFYQKRRQNDYTNRVITLWYRPPELLFGTTIYGPEVDMWSAGCIMLELFTKKPVFQGTDEIHQLDVIYKVLGTPTSERWPGVTTMPWYELVKPKEVIPNPFRDLFKKWLSPCGMELAEELLRYDPSKRISAAQALQHPYFTREQPPPEQPTGLITLEGEWHELETKREKARKRKKEAAG